MKYILINLLLEELKIFLNQEIKKSLQMSRKLIETENGWGIYLFTFS